MKKMHKCSFDTNGPVATPELLVDLDRLLFIYFEIFDMKEQIANPKP